MAKKDSLNKTYSLINIFLLFKKITFYFTIIATLLTIWFSNELWFEISSVTIVCLFFFFTFIFEFLNYRAEKTRIINAVEVGFGKKIDSTIETEEYYNNNLSFGLNKFNLNIFESVFFTKKVFENKIVIKYLSYVLFFIVFIVSLIIAPFNIACLICEVVFSCGIALEIYKTILFHVEINNLYKSFDSIFVSHCESRQKETLLAYTYQYEKLKSYISLSLNSKNFNKMNDELSNEWNRYLAKLTH